MIETEQDFICKITPEFKQRAMPYHISYVTAAYQEYFLGRKNGKFFAITAKQDLDLGLTQVHPIRLFNGSLRLKEACEGGEKIRRKSWGNQAWAIPPNSMISIKDAVAEDWEIIEWKYLNQDEVSNG